ncbi:MAG: 4-alpha-glucanotransferase [Prevotella sp.]|nr:4-alpha-glucanotransferase [Prevotella sp.]
MNLHFNIDYHTAFGEELVLNIISSVHDGGHEVTEYRMGTLDGMRWTCEVSNVVKSGECLDYYYSLMRGDQVLRYEWKLEPHRLEFAAQKASNYIIYDHWKDIPDNAYLYSSAFTDTINRRERLRPAKHSFAQTVRLKVRAPQLRRNERLAVLGNDEVLGNWSVLNAVAMIEHNYNEWIVDIDVSQLSSSCFEMKFVVLDEDVDVTPVWELGSNRVIDLPEMNDGDIVVYELPEARFDLYDVKCAGTLVPVFSLRSESSFGVGDFGDLRKMVDWVARTGQRLLQILPINDTTTTHTWTDSYPYSCISIFALHPQYADLTALPAIKDEALRAEMEQLRTELNALPQIDYERVNNAKIRYLRIIFEQEGKAVLASAGFKQFFSDSKQWLVPYAQYSLLRDKYGTADFSQWPDHNTWDEANRSVLSSPRNKAYKEVAFYYYVQYVLNGQMAAVHEYARERGVILKGDIPIGVNRYGCDVWQEPRYFHLDGQAGAPPDDFSANGQNWGFPTYNWEEMLADNCAWWVRRFSNMSKYFDAYRIDHVLGFFRIWEIPIDSVHGLLGQFSPSLAMTISEIEAYGLHFREQEFLTPYINDHVLDEVFKEHAQEVRERYVEPAGDGFYRMRPDYDTQRKVEKAFEGKTDEVSIMLRDGLYALISDVLFVRDHRDANKLHPRIAVQHDFIYEALTEQDKFVFNRLYDDYYYRRNNQFWYREAMNKLPRLVDATRMLVCAEDLGMVPDCVPWVMNELKILSLELQSMPKDPTVKFGHLSRNPYRSVCTISSHDMPTLRQWWDEKPDRTQEYYNTMLYRGGEAPHPLPGWLARDIISRHLTSPSMLCVISIQDWLAIDERLRLADANAERINIPANPRHYWRYRMHLTIEQLMADDKFNENLSDLISQSGR